jgi:hypothetical protein
MSAGLNRRSLDPPELDPLEPPLLEPPHDGSSTMFVYRMAVNVSPS